MKVLSNIKEKFLKIAVKVLFSILLLSTTSPFQTVMVEASNGTIVKVEPHTSFARVGEQFTINITVINVQNLYGIEIILYWNASILDIINVDVRLGVESHPEGVLYEPVEIVQNETFQPQGKYVLAGLSAAPEPPLPPSFNGSGTIVILTFNVTGAGRCELNLETKLVSNIIPPGSTSAALIEHNVVDGFFGPISIIVHPWSVLVGENVNISGYVCLHCPDIPITILYRSTENGEWQFLKTINTTEHGSYTYLWNPKKGGKYYVKTTATILDRIEESPTILITVKEPEQSIWPYMVISILAFLTFMIGAAFLLHSKRKGVKRKKLQK